MRPNRRWTTIPAAAALPLLASTLAFAGPAEDKGLKIAVEIDQANEGFQTEVSDVTMDLINAHGDVVNRKMTLEILEGQRDGDKSIASFLWPADVKGTRLLTYTHKKGDDDQWLFMPAIKRIKRINARNKSGSFMGSEFAYEDMSSQEVEKYTYKFLEEAEIDGRTCWKMERYPTDPRSGYTRQVIWNDQEYMNPLRIDYYDRKDELLKTATFTGYTKIDKWWRVETIEMVNVQTKKKSILTWKTRKFGVDLDPDDFESEALED